jgi:hypothetical protein
MMVKGQVSMSFLLMGCLDFIHFTNNFNYFSGAAAAAASQNHVILPSIYSSPVFSDLNL